MDPAKMEIKQNPEEKENTDPDIMTRLPSVRQGDQNNSTVEPLGGGTKRAIKSRHAQMIVMGGAIGTALFITTGQALATGGPLYLLLSYIIISCLIYGILTAIVEMGAQLPLPGSSMARYCSRYVSTSLGFALGWLYFYSFGIISAYEVTAATLFIDYWPNTVPVAVWITLLILVIVAVNALPVQVFAETEFWMANIKVVLMIGLLILSVVLMCGGGPTHDRLGFRYWYDPGATKPYLLEGSAGQFTAFLSVLIMAGFSFYFSPELIIFTTGEMENPRKTLPRAANQFVYRLVAFYILGAIAIGATCYSTAPGLVSDTGNANSSPWVIAIRIAEIPVLPSIVNAATLTSAISAGVSYQYMATRALYSLALVGNAPSIFARCSKQGLPYVAVAAGCCFLPLAYLVCGTGDAGNVFNYFVSLTNSAGYISWTLCAITYLRFREASRIQGIVLPYRSWLQPWSILICLLVFPVLLLLNGFTVFLRGHWALDKFITSYLGIVIFCTLWLGHKFTVGKGEAWIRPVSHIDLTVGLDAEAVPDHDESGGGGDASQCEKGNMAGTAA